MTKFMIACQNRLFICELDDPPVMKKIDGAGDVVNMTKDKETDEVLIFTKNCQLWIMDKNLKLQEKGDYKS